MLLRAGRAGETTPVRRVKIATNEKATRGERGGREFIFFPWVPPCLTSSRAWWFSRTHARVFCVFNYPRVKWLIYSLNSLCSDININCIRQEIMVKMWRNAITILIPLQHILTWRPCTSTLRMNILIIDWWMKITTEPYRTESSSWPTLVSNGIFPLS